jgi:L-fuculose-phosphate aldolase
MKNINQECVSAIVHRAVMECLAAGRSNPSISGEPQEIFRSPEANALKEEVVRAGRKLWERQYVDGNGGNISVRVSPHYVLCTPTLCSKADLGPDDLSLIDLDNYQICGDRPQTSEILLHLEIYKAVPSARAVIHCHPPYATAHAIAGVIPPGNMIPEQEIFVGQVALAPYETPGTQAFAETVLPYVKDHNTILLANHGIVCWADTVTHAEWYVEVVENYCKMVVIAAQLRPKMNVIPPEKMVDLLARKKRMGLPDPRLANGTGSAQLPACSEKETQPENPAGPRPGKQEIDELVRRLTQEILAVLDGKA